MNLVRIVQISPTKYKVQYRDLKYKFIPYWEDLRDSFFPKKQAEFYRLEDAEKQVPKLLNETKWKWEQMLFWNKVIKSYNNESSV